MNEVLKVNINKINEEYSFLIVDYQYKEEIERGNFEFEAKNGVEIKSENFPILLTNIFYIVVAILIWK